MRCGSGRVPQQMLLRAQAAFLDLLAGRGVAKASQRPVHDQKA